MIIATYDTRSEAMAVARGMRWQWPDAIAVARGDHYEIQAAPTTELRTPDYTLIGLRSPLMLAVGGALDSATMPGWRAADIATAPGVHIWGRTDVGGTWAPLHGVTACGLPTLRVARTEMTIDRALENDGPLCLACYGAALVWESDPVIPMAFTYANY